VSNQEVTSHGVTEGEVVSRVLGQQVSGNRETDIDLFVQAARAIEERLAWLERAQKVAYHKLYGLLKPDNSDVWLNVGLHVTQEEEPTDPAERRKWRYRIKTRAWRMAHPTGIEVEPPTDE
jgi:hypothetical protein